MAGIPERTTRQAPCIFCGDVGYDMRMHYTTENGYPEIVHWCHKTHAFKGDILNVGATSYICKTAGKQIETGFFDLWTEYLTKEEWIKRHKSTDGYQVSGKKYGGPVLDYNSKEPVKGEEKPLSNKKLHEIYSYMLSLMKLEKKHYALLAKEWQNPLHPSLCDLLSKGLVSLPPKDNARFANSEKFENLTRKEITRRLVAKFGTLRGVPGFYLRSGSYFDGKPEEERWTFSGGEGIVFPCFDKDGYIYRLRYREDYPSMELKKDIHAPFHGKYGTFHHYYNKEGKHCWSFTEKETKATETVYEPSLGIYAITLNEKGLPSYGGKASGKYKTLSSRRIELKGNEPVNTMEGGCGSGSPYAFYVMKGQPFTVVLGTEGEKKAMISSYIKGMPSVSVPGVTSYECLFEKDDSGESLMDVLKKRGMKYFLLCYDADKHENDMVLNSEKAFVERLKQEGVIPLIGEWKGKFNKGIDDILLMGLDVTVRPAK